MTEDAASRDGAQPTVVRSDGRTGRLAPVPASALHRNGSVVHSAPRFVPRESTALGTEVYPWCMARTNIDLDDEACRAVMERYRLLTKRDAVNFALRTVAAESLDLEGARGMRGSGWDGDLDEMRSARTP